MKKKLENIGLHVLAIFVILVLVGACLLLRWAWLTYTPCSLHSVKDAPVRCINGN